MNGHGFISSQTPAFFLSFPFRRFFFPNGEEYLLRKMKEHGRIPGFVSSRFSRRYDRHDCNTFFFLGTRRTLVGKNQGTNDLTNGLIYGTEWGYTYFFIYFLFYFLSDLAGRVKLLGRCLPRYGLHR